MFGNSISFAQPYFLYLLGILPLLGFWYWWRYHKSHPDLQVADSEAFITAPKSWRQRFYPLLYVIRILVIGLLILVMARPQSSMSRKNVSIEGIDIVMAFDISGSMLAEDLRPNRLEAAKEVASDFISDRPNDRVGLVIFSGESFTQCPLTTDHAIIASLFKDVQSGMIEDGTAIGDGLATAINRLKDSEAKSKVIILLTDGENNQGSLDPMSAAEIAKLFNIRVYTIGVGTNGMAPYPIQTPFGRSTRQVEVKIDESTLKSIAGHTGGKYFRATDNRSLQDIYQAIDQLEKSRIDVTEYEKKSEEFFLLALAAMLLFGLELILRTTLFRSLP